MKCDRCDEKATETVYCWVGCAHDQCARCAEATKRERERDREWSR